MAGKTKTRSKRIGVILAGCGFKDGAEIHESVLTLLALDRAGAQAVVFAPNVTFAVVDHTTGKPTGEERNVLVEAARIARGEIADLATAKMAKLDGLILPGGYGAAKNLCDFAARGKAAVAHPEVARVVRECLAARKPLGAICIAPAVIAAIAGPDHPRLTIGTDAGTAEVLVSMGCRHENHAVDEIAIDADHRLVSTPAYMLGPSIAPVARGIDKLVAEILAMCA